jgi:UDP-3-O-[3-hydroxymyristoyl] N-acetylglucosamine deacetylase
VAAPIRLEGYALHGGSAAAVALTASAGPVRLAQGFRRAELDGLAVTNTDAAVRVSDGRGLQIDLVEHFLAALGGLGIRDGVTAEVFGPEFPLLDGGARELADALLAMGLPLAPPRLEVARAGVVELGKSSYAFEPGRAVELSVEIDFAHPAVGRQEAHWSGDPIDFRERIACARTFGFVADAAELRARDRARLFWSSDPAAREAASRAVVTYDAADAPRGGAAPARDEAARHKLLDLIGDLALYGGPPKGSIRARRPGHAATHDIVRRALDLGLLSRR